MINASELTVTITREENEQEIVYRKYIKSGRSVVWVTCEYNKIAHLAYACREAFSTSMCPMDPPSRVIEWHGAAAMRQYLKTKIQREYPGKTHHDIHGTESEEVELGEGRPILRQATIALLGLLTF